MDLLARGSEFLAAKLKGFVSREVVYSRGPDSVTVVATVGETELEAEIDDGADLQRWKSRTFLIDTADLQLQGERILPEQGDRIAEPVGDETHVFEVMAPGNVPHWTYLDPHRFKLRIRTKEINRFETV